VRAKKLPDVFLNKEISLSAILKSISFRAINIPLNNIPKKIKNDNIIGEEEPEATASAVELKARSRAL
jgi:hypothetical protein